MDCFDSASELTLARRNSSYVLASSYGTGRLGEPDEKRRVTRFGSKVGHDLLIAGNFPLDFQPSSNPADGRTEVENAFQKALNQVRPIVIPSNVSELV
jgi:hypothetical protein